MNKIYTVNCIVNIFEYGTLFSPDTALVCALIHFENIYLIQSPRVTDSYFFFSSSYLAKIR